VVADLLALTADWPASTAAAAVTVEAVAAVVVVVVVVFSDGAAEL